ncbi:DEAD/DEAH box helicase, partial [bacterium]|nr:DEAD/DEAH box helicase [bacterium]
MSQLYTHQVSAIEVLRDGKHVVIETGTASGKTLCYILPTLETFLNEPHATALYLFPTKALAQDQLRAVRAFAELNPYINIS